MGPFKVAGWLSMVASLLGLLIVGIIQRFSTSVAMAIALLFIVLLTLYFILTYRHKNVSDGPWQFETSDFYDVLFVYFAAILTYNVSMYEHFSSVFASSLVGLVGSVMVKRYEKPIFCGSFVGMAMSSVFGAWGFVFAALIAGIIYVFSNRLFRGLGGKLGTIAFSGIVLSVLLNGFHLAPAMEYTLLEGVWLVIAGIIGALLTRVLVKKRQVSVVAASALIGLLFSLLFDYEPFTLAPSLALVGYGSSFVGMSDETKLPTYASVVIGGLFFSVLFYLLSGVFNGAGGKLGTMALIAVILTNGVQTLIIKIRTKSKIKPFTV